MAAIGSRKPSLSRKSLAGQALFVVVLLLVARFLWARNQPERLTTLSTDKFTISGEHLYRSPALNKSVEWPPTNTLEDPVTIQVQSVYSPQRRTLIQDDPHYAFCQPYTLSMIDGKVYYAIRLRSNSTPPSNSRDPNDIHSSPGPPSAVRDPGAMRYLGTFLLPSKSVAIPSVAGQTRKKLAAKPMPDTDRGGLYCLLDQPHLTSKDHPHALLCRLHPDRSDPIEIVRELPREAGFPQLFDGGYLYFVLNEKHRSLWAILTNDEAAEGDFTTTLCRFPLE